MSKRKKDKTNSILMAIGVIALLAVIYYGGQQGWFQTMNIVNTNNYNQEAVPATPNTEYWQYNVMLSTDKSVICQGDDLRISIDSNIPNGVCAAFYNYNNQGWHILQSAINLNVNGDFSTVKEMNIAIGTYQGRAVCGDMNGNWRTSNIVNLQIVDCGNGDGGNNEGDGSNQIACESVWNPSISNCENAVCSDATKCCVYVADTTTVPDHCACQLKEIPPNNTIYDCNSYCNSLTNAGFTSGQCTNRVSWNDAPLKNPCANIGTHVSTGDMYCPNDPYFTASHEWCCCMG